jgi:hypothetical protein
VTTSPSLSSPFYIRPAVYAWIATLVWFGFLLATSSGWVGSGPAFLLWSAPAFPLAVITWSWLRRGHRSPSKGSCVALLVAWMGLTLVAWDGGDHLIPATLFRAFTIALDLFPRVVVDLALWLLTRCRSAARIAA